MANSRTQAEIVKAAHDFVQRLQVRADPWEVSEKTLVELFMKFALAQRGETMTVKQAIDFLSKLPDKEVMLMVDCPHCGRGSQLATIVEAIVLKSEEEKR